MVTSRLWRYIYFSAMVRSKRRMPESQTLDGLEQSVALFCK